MKMRLIGLGVLTVAVLAAPPLFAEDARQARQQAEMQKARSQMSAEELAYCDNVLSKITAVSTEAEVIALLGTPSRDIKVPGAGSKKNWWVTLGGKQSRVGVYFSGEGMATEVVLDGNGRFYYRYKL
ncbi:MAG: hypothetical protein Q8Q08_01840 [Candidatus Omnitrophota bacterium]|nr:hypothetical protein [Candidatus Omnitrophota bacterium]MDZ4242782.1 hypothetical protein [Candidatus Omnitrophota bacterium]